MINTISILGSTGSIGTQTLEVCRELNVKVAALTCSSSIDLLEKQVREFKPSLVSVGTAELADDLRHRLFGSGHMPEILYGMSGNNAAAVVPEAQAVVAAMVGVAGLEPVLKAIKAGKDIALANKETLVAGGALVMPEVNRNKVRLLPVDSEHSAIWQCLAGAPPGSMRRILLTASGGPFRGRGIEELASITVDQALAHPTWKMGGKITIDSATLMNKGLEVIEASWLFDCDVSAIDVVVHPQSIIHSMVEFKDGSVMAQMGFPDMKLPIQLALTWPERVCAGNRAYNPFDSRSNNLTFEQPDRKTFRLLDLAYQAAASGGTMPAVMNAANEESVWRFLAGEIGFLEIAEHVEHVMEMHERDGIMTKFDFADLMAVDQEARQRSRSLKHM
ncbi:MAG: 1-deoxy-D-xylulose-5-phosphate reductoisomerase [Clostridiales bacterium]|jgi:1-deoxy-D-xylulose-5-phosphate reductoisomerase|nr:1-deoxy-D-xylulose-5-phosphate reductoisomerase [Clostridiales bacterium]